MTGELDSQSSASHKLCSPGRIAFSPERWEVARFLPLGSCIECSVMTVFWAPASLTHECVSDFEFGKHVLFKAVMVAAETQDDDLICPTQEVVSVMTIEIRVGFLPSDCMADFVSVLDSARSFSSTI